MALKKVFIVFLTITLSFAANKPAQAENNFATKTRQIYQDAHCAYQTEDYLLAVQLFSSLQDKYPQMGDYVQHYLALSYLAIDNYSQAQQAWQRLIDHYPQSRLKQSAQIKQAEVYFRQEFYLTAAKLYQQLLKEGVKNKSNLANIYYNFGLSLEVLKQPEQAAAIYQHAWYNYPTLTTMPQIKERMDVLEAKYQWGLPQKTEKLFFTKINAFKNEGAFHLALQTTEEFLKEFPESKSLPKLYATRAEIYLDLNQKNDAMAEFKRVYQNYPESDWATTALYQTGKTCWNLGHDVEAVRYLALLVKKYPHSTWLDKAFYVLGRIHESNEAYNRALRTYKRLITSYPHSSWADQARWRMGWIHYRLEQYPRAVHAFDQALNKPVTSPWKESALYWKGRALEHLGEIKTAGETYNKLIETSSYTYYAQLAQKRLFKLSKNNPYIPPLEPVKTLPWKTPNLARETGDLKFHFQRAQELFHLASNDDLKGELDELSKSSQQDLAFWLYLNRAYQTLGNYPQAIRAISSYQNLNQCRMQELEPSLRALLYPRFYWHDLAAQAEKYKLDPYLLAALIKQESGFDHDAKSRAGALGLMQIMPKTAAKLAEQLKRPKPGDEQLVNPTLNIQLGSYYLLQLLKHFDGELHLALAAYNAGEDAAHTWQQKTKDREWEEFMEEISFSETRTYVRQVLSNYNNYLLLYKEPQNAFEHTD